MCKCLYKNDCSYVRRWKWLFVCLHKVVRECVSKCGHVFAHGCVCGGGCVHVGVSVERVFVCVYTGGGASPMAQRLRICLHYGRHRRCRFDPWVVKIPWRRAWQSTPVFLPAESHRQRSLAGYSPWGRKQSDMAKQLTL